jgi:hypothetical protein
VGFTDTSHIVGCEVFHLSSVSQAMRFHMYFWKISIPFTRLISTRSMMQDMTVMDDDLIASQRAVGQFIDL